MDSRPTWHSIHGLQKSLAAGELFLGELRAQVESCVEALTKTGKPYYQLNLRDQSGAQMLRFWQDAPLVEEVKALQPNQAIALEGTWIDKGYGPEISEPKLRTLDPAEEEDLLAGSRELRALQEQAWAEISRLVKSLQEPRLKALIETFFAHYEAPFRRAAAAANFHHARRGGLLEHVAQMMRSAEVLCGVYPQLNRDLLLSGAFFHDIGKLWENPIAEHSFTQTPQFVGELLGHINIGIELINKLWHQLETAEAAEEPSPAEPLWQADCAYNKKLRLHLLHLIASHHGEHEWGSPVLPKTPEAIALHYIDNLDAKLEMFAQGYQTSPEVAAGIHAPVRPLRQKLVKGFESS